MHVVNRLEIASETKQEPVNVASAFKKPSFNSADGAEGETIAASANLARTRTSPQQPAATGSRTPAGIANNQWMPRRNNMPLPAGRMANPAVMQAGGAGMDGAGPAVNAMAYGNGMSPAPAPTAYVPGGSARAVSYDNAQMPGYAWPSYASYPNYAALTYPQQYSPTAWPYIGPFYPYPQVPLAWRKVSLEWDDGWWFLDFSAHNSSH
jgi:hypothetical protein